MIRRIPKLLISAAALLLMAGCACFPELRSSSRTELSDSDSQVVLPMPMDQAESMVSELFKSRGFPLIDRRTGDNAEQCTYKGNRSQVTVVTGDRNYVSGSSTDVGSFFAVDFMPDVSGGTQAVFFGKPTVMGNPICSDQDYDFGLPCEAVNPGILWPGRDISSGREEAEVIRGLLAELKMKVQGIQPLAVARRPFRGMGPAPRPEVVPAAARPEQPPEVRCHLVGTPDWENGDATTRKMLLDQCEASGSAP